MLEKQKGVGQFPCSCNSLFLIFASIRPSSFSLYFGQLAHISNVKIPGFSIAGESSLHIVLADLETDKRIWATNVTS